MAQVNHDQPDQSVWLVQQEDASGMPKDLSKLSPRDLVELSGSDDEEIVSDWWDRELVLAQGEEKRAS